MEIASGEIYGLLGRNGAGKTTLVKILLDLVRSTTGKTSLFSRPTSDPSSRCQVGYLPEDLRFHEYHNAETALHFYGSLSGIAPSTLRKKADALLSLVELQEARKKKIRAFSKGMKQRLGLAQAMIHDPTLLFLDEPTDGVDPVGRAEIRRILETLRDEGTTIFLNSHLLSEVEQICNRVGILERGSLVREGPLEKLLEREKALTLRTESALEKEPLAGIATIAKSVRADGRETELILHRAEDLDRIVDRLRSQGIGIRALEPKRLSLEEIFLHAVQEKESP